MKVMYRPSPRQISTKQIFTEKWHESRSATLHYLNRRDINSVPNGDLIRSRGLFHSFPRVIRSVPGGYPKPSQPLLAARNTSGARAVHPIRDGSADIQ